MEEREMAYFRAELVLLSPESYSLQEKAAICEGMLVADAKAHEAMRSNFWMLPHELRPVLFKALLRESSFNEQHWRRMLDYWD